jgi:hypothetical protein
MANMVTLYQRPSPTLWNVLCSVSLAFVFWAIFPGSLAEAENGPAADLVGITLGMPIKEAQEKMYADHGGSGRSSSSLSKGGMSFKFEIGKSGRSTKPAELRGNGIGSTWNETFPTTQPFTGGPRFPKGYTLEKRLPGDDYEKFVLMLDGNQGKEIVLSAYRYKQYGSRKQPLADNIVAQLREKYGPNPTYVMKAGNSRTPNLLIWNYTPDGKLIKPPGANNFDQKRFCVAGLIKENPEGFSVNELSANCGLSISAHLRTNKEFLVYFTVAMVNQRELIKANAYRKKLFAELKAQQQANEVRKASGMAKEKL